MHPSHVHSLASLIAISLLASISGSGAEPPGPGLAPVEVKVSSSQASDPKSLIDGRGVAESKPGSGVFVHTNSKYAENGSIWNANYGDAKPWLVFDLGKAANLTGAHIWNGNEKGYENRSVRALDVLVSPDGAAFEKVGTFKLKKASGRDDDAGEEVLFAKPMKARFVRFEIQSNYKPGDPAALSEVRFLSPDAKPAARQEWVQKYPTPAYPRRALGSPVAGAENIVFPADAGVIDVTKPPYGAKGDGIADDTEAIQRALAAYPNQGAIIYLPNGIYLISATLKWPHGTRGGEEEKDTTLQGQSAAGTILKLKDRCEGFDLPRKPRGMIWTGSAPAQRFANEVRNLTFDTGSENPGAVGMQFMANNQGCIVDVRVISGDGRGVAGIDLRYSNENGPLFISRVRVTGFDYGIWTANSINSQTLENVELEHQNVAGLRSDGQTLAVRKLTSRNTVPAVLNKGGHLALIDSDFTGTGEAGTQPAVVNSGDLFARNVRTRGYAKALDGSADNLAGEYASRATTGGKASLALPIKETPQVPWDELSAWVAPQIFGAVANDKGDDTAAIQLAIDSGATTIYFPRGSYKISDTILVRGKARRLIGCRANLDVAQMKKPVFQVVGGDAPVVVFERFGSGYTKTPTFDNASARTVVIQHSINVCGAFTGPGDLFLNDVCSNPSTNWNFAGQRVWARQLNVENQGEHVINDRGTLWILGMKTERTGPLLITKNGGHTELLGGFSYTTGDGKDGPMFSVENASAFLFFREVCFNGTPYHEIVRTTVGAATSIVRREDAAFKGASLLLRAGN